MNTNIRILIILLIMFSSCQKREFNNPFDPECPKETWTPTDLAAKQQGNAINLTWVQAEKNVSGFRIERKIEGETSWKEVVSPEKATYSWADQSITGGKLYEYRIVALAGGNESNFATVQIKPLLAAMLTTAVPLAITATSALLGGTITADGGAAVTERGICWATTTAPTTGNNKLVMDSGTGTFISTVTGLTTNTTYYARAYAINSQGTAYGNEVSFKTFNLNTVADIDGNIYNTVTIGTQVWMVENLKTTKYNDGTAIPNVTENTTWAGLSTGAYCWYNNEVKYKNTYGALYNYYAVSTNKLAPTGWHVPTDSEWTTLENYLGGSEIAGKKLIETGNIHWTSINNLATNESGFTARPGGVRSTSFNLIGTMCFWWSNTEYLNNVWFREVNNGTSKVSRFTSSKVDGLSVRCILGTLYLPSISTTAITNSTSSSATCGGNITSDGGVSITSKGVCWSTSANPTISNSNTTDGIGSGSFTSNLTSLTANTTYYVRAYAINSQGTAYGNEVSFKTLPAETAETVSDIDGNIYHTVTIGTQIWMVENLKTTKYNDGTPIPNIIDNSAWANLTSGACCFYDNDASSYKNTYGALYNWFAVNTGKLAPTGWHVPTDGEWTTLITYLGGVSVAGGKLKETGTSKWLSPNTGATNETGFTAIPSSYRYGNGAYDKIGTNGFWWSLTEYSTTDAWFRYTNYLYSYAGASHYGKQYGYSVRCLRD